MTRTEYLSQFDQIHASILQEEAKEIAKQMNDIPVWDNELCAKLCKLAGLENEWKEADGETFEKVVYDAADRLGVDVD